MELIEVDGCFFLNDPEYSETTSIREGTTLETVSMALDPQGSIGIEQTALGQDDLAQDMFIACVGARCEARSRVRMREKCQMMASR